MLLSARRIIVFKSTMLIAENPADDDKVSLFYWTKIAFYTNLFLFFGSSPSLMFLEIIVPKYHAESLKRFLKLLVYLFTFTSSKNSLFQETPKLQKYSWK